MLSEDSFHYALENTRVLVPPQARLSTFGSSYLNYYLITEDMDQINLAHVREGQVEAERPQIISPAYFAKLLVEGFGERAEEFARHISGHAARFSFLKYGFRFRKSEVRSYEVHQPIDTVIGMVKDQVAAKADPLAAILQGVDDAWEVCLLKFMVDLIHEAAPGHIDDLRRRGLLGGE